jgi:polysaccharide biosynthesis protein PslA
MSDYVASESSVPTIPMNSSTNARLNSSFGRKISLHRWVVAFFFTDLLIIFMIGVAYSFLQQSVANPNLIAGEQIATIVVACGLFVAAAQIVGVYRTRRIFDRAFVIPRLAAALAVTFAMLVVIAAATKTSENYSRIWFFSWAALVCSIAPMLRLAVLAAVQRRLTKGDYVYKAISASIYCDPLKPEIIAARCDNQVKTTRLMRFTSVAEFETLGEHIMRDDIDRVYVATPWIDAPLVLQELQKLKRLSAEILVLPDDRRVHARQIGVSSVGNRLSLHAVDEPIDGWGVFLKRAQDVAIASALLLFFSPILILIAAAITLDSRGPVFFRQKRVGFKGRIFELWKFRSMYVESSDADAARQTSRDDDRVTRVGRFLRCSSLDELPQFFNVLQGTMSIVGPRPHALQTRARGVPLEDVVDQYAARHRVKPGITGWAQVNGYRGELDSFEKVEKRVEFDIDYIERWSTWLDLKIIMRTALIVLYDPAAY